MNRKMIWNDGLDSWTEEELLCMKYLNVCYGKGGGSAPPPPSSVQQSTTAEFPTELRPFVSDIFEKSQAIQEQRQEEGYQPELTQQLASFTPEQEASFQGIQNVVGQTQPLFDEATTLARQSGRAATDPAEVAALMNPFLRNVTDIQKREAQRVGDVQEQQLAAQASQAGAFGGSRAAILEAERQRNLSQQLGDIEAQGLAASFQNAQNQLQNQFGRESAAAAQLGALGAAIPAQQFKEFGALSGIGAAKQQQAQRAFDIATQQAREEYGFPMATLQDFSSILRGFPLPATQNVSRQSFSPAQPLSTQLLGLGTGLAGLAGAAGAFKKAGGLVGAPVGMKNGGYVKLAGGGGLGQMMQGKVKKYAEGGSTQIELLSQYSLRELEQLLNNPARVAELGFSPTLIKAELDKKVAARGSVQDAARASAQGQFIEGMKQVPGQIVDAAQALPAQLASVGEAGARAGQAVSSFIPRSGALADQTADVLKSFMTRDGEKLGVGDVGRMDPTGMLGETRAPASSQSAQAAGAETPTIPTNLSSFLALKQAHPELYERPIYPAAPSTMESMDVGIAPPPVPAAPNLITPKDDSMGIFERHARSNEMEGIGFPGLKSRGLSALPSASASPVATQLISAYTPEPLNMNALASRIRSGDHRGSEPRRKTAPGERLRPIENTSLATVDPSVGEVMKAEVDERARLIEEGSDSTFIPEVANDLVEAGASAGRQTTTAPKIAAPKPAMDGAVTDPLTGKDPEKTAILQADYDAQIADIKGRDYSADIKKMLGDAPTYEKGEEPDFAARKWLALANFGAGILASGGGKTLAQSIGEAAKPALKELTDIGKEERKIKKELRQEKNAQKRTDYQDKLQRFNLRRQLKSDDIDAIKAMATISQKEADLKISRKTAETQRKDVMANAGLKRLQTETLDFDNFMKRKGYRTLDQVRTQLDSYRQTFIKSQMAYAKAQQMPYSVDKVISEANKLFNAEAPNLINRAVGNTVKTDDKGNVITYTREELVQRLAPLGATPTGGGRTTYTAGQGAPKKQGE